MNELELIDTNEALDSIQLHGGYGFTEESPAERYLLEAKVLLCI